MVFPDLGRYGAAAIQPRFDLSARRRQIPLFAAGTVPLNACSQAPLTLPVRAALERFLGSWNERGMDWEAWIAEVEAARQAFARLVGAEADEISVCSSVSEAAARVASALDFSGPRRRILASGAEFPTVGHTWLAHGRRGAEVEWVPVEEGEAEAVVPDLAAWERHLDERVVLVSACHAWYQNGGLQDVATIARRAHAHGALLFVDACQTAGILPIDVRELGVDFLAAGCLKYLMGTAGIAFLYVRRELAETLEPAATGWFGRRDPFAFRADRLDWAPGARRFDGGTPPLAPAFAARAGMELLEEIGIAAIEAWTGELSRHLLSGARERGLSVHGHGDPRLKTPATAIRAGEEAHRVEARMRERGYLVSARGPVVRLAPHYYSERDDLDGALDALAEILREVG